MVEVKGTTRTCGLIGNPVEHTFSPLIHNHLAHMLNQDMVYVPFHVADGQLGNAVKGAYGLNILGCNVTIPYKHEVISHLSEIDSLAEKIGAVNTLVRTDTGYKGYNTDITGLLRAMQSDGISLAGEQVVILGAGGVGRAVAFMCAANGADKVYLLNRTVQKCEDIAKDVNQALQVRTVQPMALSDYHTLPSQKFLTIQCTNVGLYPKIEEAVIEEEAFYQKVKVGYDLIFNPVDTKFMQLVKAQGGQAYNGLKMLLFQAIDAYELWNKCSVSDVSAYKIYELLQEKVGKR